MARKSLGKIPGGRKPGKGYCVTGSGTLIEFDMKNGRHRAHSWKGQPKRHAKAAKKGHARKRAKRAKRAK
jgi:hypothetical protein